MTGLDARIRSALRPVPDHPKPGILFQDITPLLSDGPLYASVIAAMAEEARASGATHIAGLEARGFLFGAPVAVALGLGFVPIRKPGKLPWETVQERYALEYGEDALEAHRDALGSGHRVMIVDDVLATGGTASAAETLVQRLGAEVLGHLFLLELDALNGRARLRGRARALLTL